MNIMVIPTGFPSSDNQATMLFVYEQVKALAACGEKMTVLHVQRQPSNVVLKKIDTSIKVYSESYGKRYFARLKTFGMHVFPGINKKLFIDKVKRLFDLAWNEGERPDVIYAHFSCWAGCAAVQIGKKYNIPVVSIEHYSGFMKDRIEKSYVDGLKETIDGSMQFLAVSENLKKAVISLTKTKNSIRVIPNMIDDSFVYTPVKEHTNFIFCTLGHLSRRKRVLFLVETFCKEFSLDELVELRIGGTGEEGPQIKDYIEKNHRQKQIKMVGKLNREQSLELYKESDCFVLPSSAETFGLVYREAMGVGRPVITTNHGGWSENDWSDEFGIMIDVDDEDGLRIALRKMINSYGDYDKEKISRFMRNHYDGVIIAHQLIEIFNSVKENNK